MARSTGGAGLPNTPSGTKIPKPPKGNNVSGYFNAAGTPTFANSPQVQGLAQLPNHGMQGAPSATPVAPYVPAHSVTSTVTPSPPDLSGNNWQGFLTPDQLQGLYNAGDQYAAGMANYGPQGPVVTGAQANYGQEMQNAQYSHDVQHSQAADNLAARGMLQSGVAAGDFADLDRSLTMRQAGATSSLNTILLGAQNAIDSLNRVWGHAQLVGQGQAAIDAAGMAQYQPYQQTTQVPASGGLTPEQVKYINAGMAGQQQSAPQNPFFAQAAGKPWDPGRPGGPKPQQSASKPQQSFSSGKPQRVR